MGRIAGVTAEETKQRLLATAADVFARLGYDGSSIGQIAEEAGLSTGAIYAHYAGKAELFVATLRAHAECEFERLLGGDATADVISFLVSRGVELDRRSPAERTLLIEAIVAAKRHPEVAEVLTAALAGRSEQLTGLLTGAQQVGEVDASLPAAAVVRFALMLALGSMVIGAMDLPPVDHDDWAAVIGRVVDNVATAPTRRRRRR